MKLNLYELAVLKAIVEGKRTDICLGSDLNISYWLNSLIVMKLINKNHDNNYYALPEGLRIYLEIGLHKQSDGFCHNWVEPYSFVDKANKIMERR